jgi:F-box/leucine-rich repeat protein 10/11
MVLLLLLTRVCKCLFQTKFRFPFFTELQWYALDKYVYHLLGRSHLALDHEATVRLFGSKAEREAAAATLKSSPPKHITAVELFGLKSIVMYIHALAVSKKAVPPLIPEPINLVRDVRAIVEAHKGDSADKAVTGKPLLYWPGIRDDPGYVRLAHKPKKLPQSKKGSSSSGRADRVACKICQACISPGEC